jgi:hypothetical protein
MRATISLLALAALALPATAIAAPKLPQKRPEALEAVLRCRAITDEQARLACFDTAVATFEQATASREVVVVDRKQVRDTKRSLFGLDLPGLNIFGGGPDDEGTDVSSIESEVASAFQDGEGRWVVTLKEGGTWRQINDTILGRRPKPGSKVMIRRAAMGSYMMRIDNQAGVRARRER